MDGDINATVAIGEDAKLIIKDRSVIHGARIRRALDDNPADVNLSTGPGFGPGIA